MGRLIILILVIVTVIVLWRAFGPGSKSRIEASRGRGRLTRPATTPEIKGPEDDPDFLWEIKKERFKAQREKERQAADDLRSAELRAKDAERRAADAEQRAKDAEARSRYTDRKDPGQDADGSGDNGTAGA